MLWRKRGFVTQIVALFVTLDERNAANGWFQSLGTMFDSKGNTTMFTTYVQPKFRPLIIRPAALLLLGSIMLVLSVVAVASAGAPTPIPNLPKIYLPGSPIPENTLCYSHSPADPAMVCYVTFQGKEVFLKFDQNMKTILRAITSTQEYTIGEMFLAWGTPSGIEETPHLTSVFWGTRSAHFYVDALHPNSRAEAIQYDLEPQSVSPWQGFGRYRQGN